MADQVKAATPREMLIETLKDGDLPPEERMTLAYAVIGELDNALRQQSTYAAQLADAFRDFRRLVCTAAWALLLPLPEAPQLTSLAIPCEGPADVHAHRWLEPDAVEALRALADVDDSGYAPATGGSLMAHGILGVAQPGPTGYDGGDHAEPCVECGAAAVAHLCPAVVP